MSLERTLLVDGAQALGIELSAAQTDLLLAYLTHLAKWNRVYNLTAVRGPAERVTRHLLDSMTLLTPLARELPQLSSVVDVGSGAGFPGAVLAILMPDLEVTCVDAVAKKSAFVRQAAAELGLRRLHALHARVESVQGLQPDLIVSRAFASLSQFAVVTRHLATPDVRWLAMKGSHVDDSASLPSDVEVFHVEQVHVPGLAAERHLVWMRMHLEPVHTPRAGQTPKEI